MERRKDRYRWLKIALVALVIYLSLEIDCEYHHPFDGKCRLIFLIRNLPRSSP